MMHGNHYYTQPCFLSSVLKGLRIRNCVKDEYKNDEEGQKGIKGEKNGGGWKKSIFSLRQVQFFVFLFIWKLSFNNGRY